MTRVSENGSQMSMSECKSLPPLWTRSSLQSEGKVSESHTVERPEVAGFDFLLRVRRWRAEETHSHHKALLISLFQIVTSSEGDRWWRSVEERAECVRS
jgi:hypothetical protein